MSAPPPPPPPPPHGAQSKASGLPPGNYDIFIIPPHSSGSGFLYLPSLQPERNSFIAGCACTLAVIGLYQAIIPQLKQWVATVASSGGMGVVILAIGVAVLGWALGKSQVEQAAAGATPKTEEGYSGSSAGAYPDHTQSEPSPPQTGPQPQSQNTNNSWSSTNTAPPPKSSWQNPASASSNTTPKATPQAGPSQWEKAREDIRRKKEEASKPQPTSSTSADAEKARWEQARAREREAREKEAREKVAAERLRREQEKEKDKAPASSTPPKPAGPGPTSPSKRPRPPASATSYTESTTSGSTATSGTTFSSQSSYSTTPTQQSQQVPPPPRHSGPYSTKDPDKVVIKGVYAFTDLFSKPVAELVAGERNVTDGLVLRMTTEGLFVDDDVRGVGMREWDVKAWTLKSIESGDHKGTRTHILRATVRDVENKKYVFVVPESEAWKVALGLQRLRKGPLVRSMAVGGMKEGEVAKVLGLVGSA